MLAYCNERKLLLISFIVIILDGIIIYFVPSYLSKINYLYPMLTISFIPFISLIKKNSMYKLIIIIGSIYDVLYSNIFLYNVILFTVLVIIDKEITKYFKKNVFLFILLAILNIIIYDFICFMLIILTKYNIVNINDLLYKISNSIILNSLSVFVFWFLLKKDLHHT